MGYYIDDKNDIRRDDGAYIPKDPANADYQAFLAQGGIPAPSPVASPEAAPAPSPVTSPAPQVVTLVTPPAMTSKAGLLIASAQSFAAAVKRAEAERAAMDASVAAFHAQLDNWAAKRKQLDQLTASIDPGEV